MVGLFSDVVSDLEMNHWPDKLSQDDMAQKCIISMSAYRYEKAKKTMKDIQSESSCDGPLRSITSVPNEREYVKDTV